MTDTRKIYYVTTYNMAAKRHTTFTHTNLHGITPFTYVTIQHGRHIKIPIYTASPLPHTAIYNMADTLKIHYVTANKMAAKRHTTFANTNLHAVTAYTYVTIQHGRHTKIPIYTASPLPHTSIYNMADTLKIHYVTANKMAAKRNTTFANTNLLAVTAYTYVKIQHSRRTKNTNYTALRTHKHTKHFSFRLIPILPSSR
jgi:CxxC motif-containing protein